MKKTIRQKIIEISFTHSIFTWEGVLALSQKMKVHHICGASLEFIKSNFYDPMVQMKQNAEQIS